MTEEQLIHLFEEHEDECTEFERIDDPGHERPDLAGLLRVAELAPGTKDILGQADLGEVFLSLGLEEVLEKITEDDVVYLLRCGVDLEEDTFRLGV